MCNIIKKQICFFPLSWGSAHITVCFLYMGWIIRIVDPSMSQDFLPKLFQKNTCRKKRFSHVVDSILLEFFVMFWKSYICQFELTFIYGINMCFKTRVMSCYLQWMLDVLRGVLLFLSSFIITQTSRYCQISWRPTFRNWIYPLSSCKIVYFCLISRHAGAVFRELESARQYHHDSGWTGCHHHIQRP